MWSAMSITLNQGTTAEMWSSTSASTPPPGTPVDDDEDSLFIPNEPPAEPQSAKPKISFRRENLISQTASSEDATGSSRVRSDEDTTVVATLTAKEQRLYRHFCEDVRAAEGLSTRAPSKVWLPYRNRIRNCM